VSASLDATSFDLAAAAFIASSKREPGAILRQQAKLFVKDVVHFTPPFPKNAISASLNEHRKVGLRAVARDIRKVFMPASKLKMLATPENPKLAQKILGYIRSGNWTKLNGILPHAAPRLQGMITAGHFIRSATLNIHNSRRGVNGRVVGGRRIVVMNASSINAVLKTQQAKVGTAKAGWMAAARHFQLTLPGWISRNSTAGYCLDRSTSTLTPFIEIANLVKDAGVYESNVHIVSRALAQRARAMTKQLEHWQAKAAAQFNR